MHDFLRVADSEVLLNGKTAAALIGVAYQTLRQARVSSPRSARHDLFMPHYVRVPPKEGTRGHVLYAVSMLVAWAKQEGRTLHWHELPLSQRLPVAALHRAAGLPLPAALAAHAALVATQAPPGRLRAV